MKKLKMYRAVKSNFLTQGFGENKSCCLLNPDKTPVRPFKIITSMNETCPVGYGSFYKVIGMKGHNGRDWMAWHGEPVYFPCEFDGWLRSAMDLDGGFGVDIVSKQPILEDEKGVLQYVKWRAWHGMKAMKEEDSDVKLGDLVMLADNTGASSGSHLHESPKWCNSSGNGIKEDNGYQGAIPPEFLEIENVFVGKVVEVIKPTQTLIQKLLQMVVQLIKMLDDVKKIGYNKNDNSSLT